MNLKTFFFIISLVCCHWLSAPASASDDVQTLFQKIIQSPNAIQNELLVYDIFTQYDTEVSPHKTVMPVLKKLSATAALSPSARSLAHFLYESCLIRTGRLTTATDSRKKSGFLTHWQILGPFDNEGTTGFDTPFLPQNADGSQYSLIWAHKGLRSDVFWRALPQNAVKFGRIHLESLYPPSKNICVYAASIINSTKETTAILNIGAAGAVKTFWNNAAAFQNKAYQNIQPNRHRIQVHIKKGANRLVIKNCSDETGSLGFFARITDKQLKPIVFLNSHFSDEDFTKKALEKQTGQKPTDKPQTTFDALLSLAQSKRATSQNKIDFARYALLSGATHPSSHLAKDMAQSACQASPNAVNCNTWAQLASEVNEKKMALETDLFKNPKSVMSLVKLAQLAFHNNRVEQAGALIGKALAIDKHNTSAILLNAQLAADQGFVLTALNAVQKLPQSPKVISTTLNLAQHAGASYLLMPLIQASLKVRFDKTDHHFILADTALAKGNADNLIASISHIHALAGNSQTVLSRLADLVNGIQDTRSARLFLQEAVELAPQNPDALKALGLFDINNGRQRIGIKTLKSALLLKPQDTWISDYLEYLKPQNSFETPYVTTPNDFLNVPNGRTAKTGEAYRYLVDTTAVRVWETGLSSRFTQKVIGIYTAHAAKSFRSHAIQFSPSGQRVKIIEARIFKKNGSIAKATDRGLVNISEPWYRLYYDLQAEIIELPPIEVGDIIEFQYKVDDTAVQNVFHDYFGDFTFVNDLGPKNIWKYAIILPKQKAMQIDDSTLVNFKRKTITTQSTITELFESHNVPPVMNEHNMPGLASEMTYLHLSTFNSWNDLGQWYTGLVRNQMVEDTNIKEIAQRLTAGKKSQAAKVQAVYNWVTSSIRYVGLEFGIHGYKPYRAPVVVSRGFGDCKDKASLLVTLLKQVGIEANFALVRTRSLGTINETPASLSVFNHAIAYIPALDLWLDGTAEHHGTQDMPFEDQGAQSLLLTPSGPKLTTTKILPANRIEFWETNAFWPTEKNLKVKAIVKAKGSHFAPAIRKLFEVKQTRRERFEEQLANKYPGSKLRKLNFRNINNVEQPASYSYEAHLPSLLKRTPNTLIISIDSDFDLSGKYAKLPKREHDLEIGPLRTYKKDTIIHIPKGYQLNQDLKNQSIKTAFGELTIKFKTTPTLITISRIFKIQTHIVPSNNYNQFIAFANAVDFALTQKVILEKTL